MDEKLLEKLKYVSEDRKYYIVRFYHFVAFGFLVLGFGLEAMTEAKSLFVVTGNRWFFACLVLGFHLFGRTLSKCHL